MDACYVKYVDISIGYIALQPMPYREDSFSDIIDKRREENDAVKNAMIRAGVQALPFGSSALEIVDLFLPSITERRSRWIEKLDSGLRELERKVESIDLEELADNPDFVTTVLQASQIAERNHQEEKIDALRNAVLNSALNKGPDESEEQMFLNIIDRSTVWHLRILKVLQHPKSWFERQEIDYSGIDERILSHVLEAALPKLQDRESFYNHILNDLKSQGLIDVDLEAHYHLGRAKSSYITEMGSRLIKYIGIPSFKDDH
jgi:hypothetical protein